MTYRISLPQRCIIRSYFNTEKDQTIIYISFWLSALCSRCNFFILELFQWNEVLLNIQGLDTTLHTPFWIAVYTSKHCEIYVFSSHYTLLIFIDNVQHGWITVDDTIYLREYVCMLSIIRRRSVSCTDSVPI